MDKLFFQLKDLRIAFDTLEHEAKLTQRLLSDYMCDVASGDESKLQYFMGDIDQKIDVLYSFLYAARVQLNKISEENRHKYHTTVLLEKPGDFVFGTSLNGKTKGVRTHA